LRPTEFERELIRARTGDGRERAKVRGVKMGRRPKLTDHPKREAIKRRDHGEETIVEIGRSYNIISLAGESAGVRFFDLAAVPL
jgi:DNA invertase Pin-like site-specific DNA recombinase